MVSTPKKKRSASIAISPLKKDGKTAVTTAKDKPKRKLNKPYQFAPLDRLSSEDPILRSIPISRVRNIETEPKKTNSSKRKVQSEKNSSNVKTSRAKSETPPELRYSDGPSEEVIWWCSPRGMEEQLDNHYNSAYEEEQGEDSPQKRQTGPSSTPLLNDKFKDLIDFKNLSSSSENNAFDRITHGSPIKKGPPADTPVRDIDEILNDLDNTKPFPPSSPVRDDARDTCAEVNEEASMRMAKTELELNGPKTVDIEVDRGTEHASESPPCIELLTDDEGDVQRDLEDYNDGEDDDSLMDILTQRFAKPVISEAEEEQAESEDSLLELLNDELSDGLQLSENSPQLQVREVKRVEISIETGINDNDKNINHKGSTAKSSTNGVDDDSFIKKCASLAKFPFPQKGFQRLCIYDITEMKTPLQIVLTCIDQNEKKVNVVLREPWINYKYEKGMIIHLIAGENTSNKRLLSNTKDPETGLENDNLLIVYPDVLLSATAIGTAMDCQRRAILSARLNEPGEYSLAATLGNIIHELIQQLLKLKLLQPNQFISKGLALEVLSRIIEPFTTEVNMCGETIDSVTRTISDEHLPFVIEFINIYVTKDNSRSWIQVIGTKTKRKLAVSQIIDIEENIWSAKYGLKGFIDVTVETTVDQDGKKLIAPVEIKTGKWKSNAHEAQGLIYTLLLQDRYDVPVNAHVMLYSKLREFSLQPKVLISLKHLLNLRNAIAKYHQIMNEELSDWGGTQHELPAMIQSSKCDQCFLKTSCMVLNKLSDKEQTPGILKHEYTDLTNHLESQGPQMLQLYRSFYNKYDKLLMMEETSVVSTTKDTFLMSGAERELTNGHCISELRVTEVQTLPDGRFSYTFSRNYSNMPSTEDSPLNLNSMLSTVINANDYVMISDDVSGQLAIGTGYVTAIDDNRIVVTCARNILANNIHNDSFDRKSRQVIQSVLLNKAVNISMNEHDNTNLHRFRIDKNENAMGLTLARYNLLNLFLPDIVVEAETASSSTRNTAQIPAKRSLGGYSKGRKLIVELATPAWASNTSKIPHLSERFNENQQRAIERSLNCRDYNLILGMPGTGKTTVICEIVSILVSRGKSVLLTSYTNSAVDNVMMKLTSMIPRSKMIRLGSTQRIHSSVKQYHISDAVARKGEETTLTEVIDSAQVVGVTCLGINDPWLQLRSGDFDYVILDEASQVSLPVAIGPLRFGYRFVLVGDHYQLPPLVKNRFAIENGLQESLFERLCRTHPQSVVELQVQYRMNADIMSLSNVLVYKGKLQCGGDHVSKQTLEFTRGGCKNSGWIARSIAPEYPVAILNYDRGSSKQKNDLFAEKDDHGQLTNVGEANVVLTLVQALLSHGITEKQIGVMSIYRGQMLLLQHRLQNTSIEVLTADQFQGRDMDCIIISIVRTTSSMLLRDLRRMNVAMSRAKKKLIIVCSWECVSKIPELKPFVDHVTKNNWIVPMSISPDNTLRTPPR